MIYIVLVFSFLLESVMSNIVPINSFLTPLFTLVSLSLIYPYFNKNNLKFIVISSVAGLFYDLIFTSFPFINTISFLLISLLIILNYKIIKYSLFSSSIFVVILITIYRLISYFMLVLINYNSFSMSVLVSGILDSMIINIIYNFIMYIIISKIYFILKK